MHALAFYLSIYFITLSRTGLLRHFPILSLLLYAANNFPQSCAAIKTEDPSAKNGAYTIQPLPSGSSYRVYCNMQDYGGGWTLVTLIKSDSNDQWNPAALYPEDLATFNTNPSRVSKLSDAEINALLGRGGTRWVTAKLTRTFYRMTDRLWNSNHGKSDSACDYKGDFYDAWAKPATKPVWNMTAKYIACGGISYDGKNWLARSGIHSNSQDGKGASDAADDWYQNGYVFVRSLQGLCLLAFSSPISHPT